MTRSVEMAAWHELVILGDVAAARKNLTITMDNAVGVTLVGDRLQQVSP